MNKDHQSQNTDQIRTKILSKNRPNTDQNLIFFLSKIQTLQTKAEQMQLNKVSSQQYKDKKYNSINKTSQILPEGWHIGFNKY